MVTGSPPLPIDSFFTATATPFYASEDAPEYWRRRVQHNSHMS